jgi:hypothetical protein
MTFIMTMFRPVVAVIAAFVLGSSVGVAVAGYVHPASASNPPGTIKVVDCTDTGFSSSVCDGTGIATSGQWSAFVSYSNNLAQTGGFGFDTTMQTCDASACGDLKFIYEVP